MHALCTVVAKTPDRIRHIIDNLCEDRYWDYCLIGGRYDRIIPVNKNVEDMLEGYNFPFNDEEYPENGFPFHTIDNNLNCKYVSIARIRGINKEEVKRLDEAHLINPFKPYSYILDDENVREIFVEDEGIEQLMKYINNPRHAFYYLAVVDYHF